MRLVVVGAGEIGGAVAARWVQEGDTAVGLTRTASRHPALRAAGVEASTEDPLRVIRPDDHVLLSIAGSNAQREMAEHLHGTPCARLVMTSSTGFYGHPDGVVDARTPAGDTDRAMAAEAAEAMARSWAASVGARPVVLRFGGLYRTGRGPVSALLRRGSAPAGPPDRILPLVHQDDAVSATLAALRHPAPFETYIVVTPPLPTRAGFYRLACERHGLEAPEFTQAEGRTARFDARAMRHDLLPEPAHPDWREATEG